MNCRLETGHGGIMCSIKTREGKAMGQSDEVRIEAGACESDCNCNCGSSGMRKWRHWLSGSVVLLAACAIMADRMSGAEEAGPKTPGFALQVISARAPASAKKTDRAGWESPLKGMNELNVVATNTEAVFLVIPSDDSARTGEIQKVVSAASATISEQGTKIGKYILSEDAEDYKAIVQQIGAPAVLAMAKGKGMSVVADNDVTKDALLKAFAGASSPSSCGLGGCGPSGCK